MMKIVERVGNFLEFDLYSLKNNFVKTMRVKIELNLRKLLVPGVKILLYVGGVSPRFFGLISGIKSYIDSIIIVVFNYS